MTTDERRHAFERENLVDAERPARTEAEHANRARKTALHHGTPVGA